jgi:hypothetical protein
MRKKINTVLNENINIENSDEDFLHVVQTDGPDDDIEVKLLKWLKLQQ